MPGPAPEVPAALHLLRLCQAAPDVAIALPGTQLRAICLTRAHTGLAGGAIICLAGEVLLDLSSGAFVHLKAGEACALTHAYRLLPPRGQATALLVSS